ncbi:MAG: hypothetical protein OQK82_03380 [Candidatus Pacearchaeota archaeon]|nr:hypothetical protein [Candidatus Pacearchaeota archaeon]
MQEINNLETFINKIPPYHMDSRIQGQLVIKIVASILESLKESNFNLKNYFDTPKNTIENRASEKSIKTQQPDLSEKKETKSLGDLVTNKTDEKRERLSIQNINNERDERLLRKHASKRKKIEEIYAAKYKKSEPEIKKSYQKTEPKKRGRKPKFSKEELAEIGSIAKDMAKISKDEISQIESDKEAKKQIKRNNLERKADELIGESKTEKILVSYRQLIGYAPKENPEMYGWLTPDPSKDLWTREDFWSKELKTSFYPSREFLKKATKLYLMTGGTIKQFYVDEDTKMSVWGNFVKTEDKRKNTNKGKIPDKGKILRGRRENDYTPNIPERNNIKRIYEQEIKEGTKIYEGLFN